MTLTHVRPRKWTKDEYYRLAELGMFQHERVELIEGDIISMTPQDKHHADSITHANRVLTDVIPRTHYVRVQLPLDVGTESDPEPDFSISSVEDVDGRTTRHPTRAELVIEVAWSSLAYDRDEKASLYARAGVKEYWIVNLADRRLEIHRDPAVLKSGVLGGEYRTRTIVLEDETCTPLHFPEVQIRVGDLF